MIKIFVSIRKASAGSSLIVWHNFLCNWYNYLECSLNNRLCANYSQSIHHFHLIWNPHYTHCRCHSDRMFCSHWRLYRTSCRPMHRNYRNMRQGCTASKCRSLHPSWASLYCKRPLHHQWMSLSHWQSLAHTSYTLWICPHSSCISLQLSTIRSNIYSRKDSRRLDTSL